MSLIDRLGRFAAELTLDSAPTPVTAQAKLTILDTLGCIAAGAGTDEAHALVRAEAASELKREATLVGGGLRLSVGAAARINAYQGDIFELNDLTGGHAGIAVVPAVLALGEAIGASGKALVEAVIAGVEITAHIYAGFYSGMKPFTESAMGGIGLASTCGAAAAAAKLLGLDAAGCANAISIGAALAPWCPAEVFFGVGGTIKPMLFGAVPACAGIKAAHYARAGFNGPKAILESPIGFYSTISHHPEPDKTADFDTWYLLAPRRKLHACCGYIHSALDNLIAMRTEGVAVADAAEINVGIPAYTFPAVSKPDLPATANEARFHLAYCLAVATTGAELISPAHCVDVAQWIDRPDVAAAIRKIRISVDPELSHYHQSTIAMHGAGGGSSYRSNEAPRGAPGNPMSDEEVRGKFRRLASGRFPETTVEFALEQILSLETRRDLSALMAALILPGPR